MSDHTRTKNRRTSYGSVLADREYRVIFAAGGLSWIGDYLARAAITLLVYSQTGSVTESAITFAISYLPWLIGGPLLAALAERYPARRVMIVCDVLRAMAVAAVTLPHISVWTIWALLFVAALLNSPFEASRAAMLARIFTDDRYVLASSMQQGVQQFAVLVGYGVGPLLAQHSSRAALLIDAATFLASAVLIASGIAHRRAAQDRHKQTWLIVETARGFAHVFRSNVLRSVAVMVLILVSVTTVPEGLAAAWATQLPHPFGGTALAQAMIMGSNPVGQIVGGFVINRAVSPVRRQRLIPILAVLAPAALVPALLHPSAPVVGVCALVSGFMVAGVMPNAIGLFARVVAPEFRTRVFGVMQTGVQLSQAVGVLIAGALADRFDLPTVVGLWSAGGVIAVLIAAASWPSPTRVERASVVSGNTDRRVPAQEHSLGQPATAKVEPI